MFDRNLLIGFGVGVIAGIVGYKVYTQNKETIEERLKGLGLGGVASSGAEGECSCASGDEISIEELEAQKERLEDLIAEQQAKTAAAKAEAEAAK